MGRQRLGPGDLGVVCGKHAEGHYRIQFRHEIGDPARGQKSFKAPMMRVFGVWFIEAGCNGEFGKSGATIF